MLEIEYSTDAEGREYVTINGRRSRTYIHLRGYIYTSNPDKNGSIGVHRLIMELVLGRKLRRNEHVHHVNGDKTDNRPENLEVWSAHDHNSHHTTLRNLKHDPATFVCRWCKQHRPHKARGLCCSCWAKRHRKFHAEDPCSECGRETTNDVQINGLCKRCACDRHDACVVCGRTRDELPNRLRAHINSHGRCHACQERIARHERQSRCRTVAKRAAGSDADNATKHSHDSNTDEQGQG